MPDQPPAPLGNPLLHAYQRAAKTGSVVDEAERSRLIATYSFAIPVPDALTAIADRSPAGVVELGAGTGYWAALLAGRGVDVVAYDIAPPPSARNRWFAGSTPWSPVHEGDESVVDLHGDRMLLLVWPTRDETWPARALERYERAGGGLVAYVGQGPGGRTGDDRFHALLGEFDRCWTCAYGLVDVACTCGTAIAWERVGMVPLPSWTDRAEALRLYRRSTSSDRGPRVITSAAPRPRRETRRMWQRRPVPSR